MDFCRPVNVVLDACTLCQLDCRDCYMRKENYSHVGAGYLTYDNFAKFIEKNDFIKKIELSNCGELFLNPDLEKILKLAFERKVSLTAWSGVNLNTVSDEMLENLIKYQFVGLKVSIDGASNEVYCQYRRKGDFETVINNIKKINAYKEKHHAHFPVVEWQYIVMDCTQDIEEIKKAKKLAAELNVKIVFKKTYMPFTPSSPELLEKETGLSYKTTQQKALFSYKWHGKYCIAFWTQPRINFDGRLFGCCCDHTGFDINVFEEGLEKALACEKIQYVRKMLMNEVPQKDISPCAKCWMFDYMKKHNDFVTQEEIDEWTHSK